MLKRTPVSGDFGAARLTIQRISAAPSSNRNVSEKAKIKPAAMP